MIAMTERYGLLLDYFNEVTPHIDPPADDRERRWLLGKVQVAMVELEGLEARLARDPKINNTPQPKTPVTPKPKPQPKGPKK